MSDRAEQKSRLFAWVACALPLLASVVFVHRFAGPLPLTDEWNYSHALRLLHGLDLTSWTGLSSALEIYPSRHHEHLVVAPFLIYAPLMELLNYDSRFIIYLTVASFAAQAWILRSLFNANLWMWFPVCLIIFAPSHYMEFMWAWQITLTWSVLFPLSGLAIIRGISSEDSRGQYSLKWTLALLAITLGTLSSAGGFFGFPAALILVVLRSGSVRTKALSSGLILMVGSIIYFSLMKSEMKELTLGLREIKYVLTAIGATLWGTPVALTEFTFGILSMGGLLILVAISAVLIRATVNRNLPSIAFPLSIVAFGLLCVIPIAMTRGYLGNWHVQYALPVVCGGFAAAHGLRKLDQSRWSLVPLLALTVLLTSSGVSYVRGFQSYGPEYRAYVRSIEENARMKLLEPWRGLPYPEQPANRDMDLDLILFLAAHNHPTFRIEFDDSDLEPLPQYSHAWIDNASQPLPLNLKQAGLNPLRLAVSFPPDDRVKVVIAIISNERILLHRIHPDHLPNLTTPPHSAIFVADIYPKSLGDKITSIGLSVLRN